MLGGEGVSNENELLEPLATEAGQQAIARAINNLSSLEYAVRAERAATTAIQKADEASNSADDASDFATEARNWATKTDGYVDQETITIPPEQEGDEPTTETIDLYSARYYAALAQDVYNNLQFDSVPTENSTNIVSSGAIYDALDLKADKSTTYTKTEVDTALNAKANQSTTYTKTEVDTEINTAISNLVNSAPSTLDTLEELADALGNDPNFATTIATQLGNKADKSDTYTKTEVDTALSNVQSTLTFDNVPTANSDNPVKSSGIKTALDGKQDTLTFDSTPTANSNNPVTSGGVYTALQNVDIDVDTSITQNSTNPVTSAAIYEALQNLPSGSEISGDVIYDVLSLPDYVNSQDLLSGYTPTATIREVTVSKNGVARIYGECATTGYTIEIYVNGIIVGRYSSYARITIDKHIIVKSGDIIGVKVDGGSNWRNVSITLYPFVPKNLSEQMYSNVLYDNKSGVSSGTITLNDSIKNYDFIEIYYKFNNLGTYGYPQFFSVNSIYNDMNGQQYPNIYHNDGSNYICLQVTSETQLSIEQYVKGFLVSKIIGHKMAKGGYSGIVSDARMTVKSGTSIFPAMSSNQSYSQQVVFDSPMPDANYNVLVCKGIGKPYDTQYWEQVDNSSKTANGFTITGWCGHDIEAGLGINWIAIRPNSYTREGMVEDVLFSSASGVNSGTINLSGNISDYDLIVIDVGASNSNKNSNIYLSSSVLETNNSSAEGRIITTRYHESYVNWAYSSDNSIIINSNGGNCVIYKITGIKFGRYVSGVAVDTTVTSGSSNVVTSGAVYDALQNAGGGSSVTVDSTITQGGTNPVEGGAIYTALGDKADKSATYTKTEVDTAVASKGDVTTNTDQNITGTKTFVGSKKVGFKQSTANDKLGFTLYGNTGTERGYLEFNPTNTIDGVAGLMTLGNYATSAASLTQVGFRRYSNISGASGAYNLLMPMVADARTPFSLTTTYQNFYLPLGFTDGTTTVRTAKSGVVDLSPLLASLESRIAALEGN